MAAEPSLNLKYVFKLLRPKQWAKGLLVFAAPLFTPHTLSSNDIYKIIFIFLAISAISSAVYVANDLIDVQRDRNHPVKKNRPIASGKVTRKQAVALGILLFSIGITFTLLTESKGSLVVVLVYLLIQFLYNIFLKQIPVADVFTLSSGFVLRASLGATTIHVPISGWLLFCTGSLALLVGFGKRRAEFSQLGANEQGTRESLSGYSVSLLDTFLTISASLASVSYGIYSLQSDTAHRHPSLILTTIWVVYGVFRYSFLVMAKNDGAEPETVFFRDRQLIFTVLMYLLTSIAVMRGLNLHLNLNS